ncbi:MAG: CHAP domain-containing protein [Candidatus Dormibacteraeota bacterium]|nr:CHAP domain-containing protein [Candidatus Dormibacteraeota bacterium]
MTRGLPRVLTGPMVVTVFLTAGGFGASASSPATAPAAKPGMISVAAKQSSTGTYGAPLIDGCSWATWVSRCQNLTVYGNGSSFDDAGCGAPNGCTFGPEFQCTELAQRYAYYAWGEPAVWDGYGGANGSAAQLWQAGPALPVPLQQFNQGGGIPPQRGDLLIFGPGWLGSYYDANGHVAVVTSVGSSSLTIVQENGTASGSDTFGLSGTTVTANGYTPVIGWLHNPVMSGSGGGKLSASSSGGQQNLFWQGTDNHLREAWAVGTTWYGPTDLTAIWKQAAPLTSPPSAVFAPDGKQTVYWRGAGGHLWQSVYTNGWSTPADLSTGWTSAQLLQSAPSAAIAPGGEQMVFWQGAGGSLMEAWFAAGTWYGPAAISSGWGGAGPLTSAPSVAISNGGLQFVYWQSTNGHLWKAWYGNGWNGPTDLSKGWGGQGPLGSAPSVVVAPNGDESVFWKGSDNHVWEAWYNGTWNGPADWDSLGSIATPPTATVTAGGSLVLYWQNTAGDLASSTWNGRWNGPADLSAMWGNTGLLGSAPAAALTPDGSTQLTFWRGANGHLLEAWYTGRWNGPIDLTSRWPASAALASAPSVAVTPDGGTQLVFWQGTDGHFWEAWYTGSWNGPVDWTARWGTGLLGSAPSVWVSPDGRQQTVFWRGADGHLDEAWFAGSWNGPVDWTSRWGSGVLASAPSAVVTPDGAEQLVFWQDGAGHLKEAWYAGSWNGPSDWSTAWSASALLGSSPSVVVTSTGNQLIFWQGTNGHLWETWWGGARSAPIDWAAASNVSAQLGSAPSAALAGSEQLAFWRSPNGHLTESWWGGAWPTPTDVSGIGPLS